MFCNIWMLKSERKNFNLTTIIFSKKINTGVVIHHSGITPKHWKHYLFIGPMFRDKTKNIVKYKLLYYVNLILTLTIYQTIFKVSIKFSYKI